MYGRSSYGSAAYGSHIAENINFSRTLSDSFGITDAITARSFDKPFSETLTIADSISKDFATIFSDAFSFSDSISKDPNKVFSDSLSLADSGVEFSIGLVKSDSLTISDTIALLVYFFRSFTDTFSISDAIVKDFGISVSDDLSIADSIVKRLIPGRTVEIFAFAEGVSVQGKSEGEDVFGGFSNPNIQGSTNDKKGIHGSSFSADDAIAGKSSRNTND